MLEKIQDCFRAERFYYSKHARDEMEADEFGEIKDIEVFDAVSSGEIIESYPEDEPYPSCLIYGRTADNRPLHIVCAYLDGENLTIIITAYQPHSDRWIDYTRRKK